MLRIGVISKASTYWVLYSIDNNHEKNKVIKVTRLNIVKGDTKKRRNEEMKKRRNEETIKRQPMKRRILHKETLNRK